MGAVALPVFGSLLSSLVVNKMTSSGPQPANASSLAAPATPEVTKPTVMPTPDSTEVAAAKRRSIADMLARQGRASTILTDQSSKTDALGG